MPVWRGSCRKILAFLRRDALTELSYGPALLLQVAGVVATALCTWFLSGLVGGEGARSLAPYGGVWFPFVLLGWALHEVQSVVLASFQGRIRQAQVAGTLEAVLVTPTPMAVVLLGTVAWDLVGAVLRLAVWLLVGRFVFGVSMNAAGLPAAFMILLLSFLCFIFLGTLGAATTLLVARNLPLGWLVTGLSILLGGVLYPVAVLPEPLRWVAAFLPLTHALEGLRRALLTGAGVAGVAEPLLWLVGLALGLGLLAWGALGLSLRRVREDGTLTHF